MSRCSYLRVLLGLCLHDLCVCITLLDSVECVLNISICTDVCVSTKFTWLLSNFQVSFPFLQDSFLLVLSEGDMSSRVLLFSLLQIRQIPLLLSCIQVLHAIPILHYPYRVVLQCNNYFRIFSKVIYS